MEEFSRASALVIPAVVPNIIETEVAVRVSPNHCHAGVCIYEVDVTVQVVTVSALPTFVVI